jgi:polyribonucleotide nucleotidyltransferase
MKKVSAKITIGDKELKLESGYLAEQADAAILARIGDTMVLATVVATPDKEELDYLPLGVEYIERLYAGGRIKGSRWVKREGKASDEAILTARLIDRSIRPLFPKGYQARVQVIITVLSVDAENGPDIPAICAASAALAISDIPWNGPIGAVRLGYVPKNGENAFIVNPTHQDLEFSEMDVVFSGSKENIVMLEGQGQEISEETFTASLDTALKEIQKVVKAIEDFAKKVGKKKQTFKTNSVDQKLINQIKKEAGKEIEEAILASASPKNTAKAPIETVIAALIEKFSETPGSKVKAAINEIIKKFIRQQVLAKGRRIDGRSSDEVRPLSIETSILPRTHGSAMFKRGKTQALTVATLGSPSLGQLIESMEGEETKRYIHHYYMPPFSTGETGRLGWPSRREVGHGSLAEMALEPVIPSEEVFPYAIRVVSEIMSSNGSTSMAAVCGSTLSLMDAGVPIKTPVAGIAMGLMSDGKKHVVLTDIMGQEDFQGDMDFKVAGSKKGITAVQMDVKNTQIPLKVLKEAFEEAKKGRIFILEKMLATLPTSRAQVSKFAPKIEVVHIPVDKIGEVVGPGGKTIKKIIADTGANIEIEDDGSVNISSPDKTAVEKAVTIVKGITREIKLGEEFEGTVRRIQPFGAFVELTPGKDGLVHVSQMSVGFVKDPSEVVQLDQKVKVRVIRIDDQKRISLTMLTKEQSEAQTKAAGPRPPSRDRFSRQGSFRGRSNFGPRGPRRPGPPRRR